MPATSLSTRTVGTPILILFLAMHRYGSGEMLTGEVKDKLVEVLQGIVATLRDVRSDFLFLVSTRVDRDSLSVL